MQDESDKLTADEVAALRRRVEADGLAKTVAALRVNRESLARVLGGLPVHRGTLLAIRSGLGGTAA